MTLKTKLSGAEHAALDESLKTLYLTDGEGFRLDADFEDVEGLKLSKTQILAEKKRLETELEGLQKFKAEHDAKVSEDEQKLLEKKGEFDKLLETKQKAFEDRIAAETAEREKIQANLKSERWNSFLAENGILSERIQAMRKLDQLYTRIELSNEEGLPLKLKDGVGDITELKEQINQLATDHPFMKGVVGASGGGANGSNGNGGATPKTLTKAQVAELDATAKRDFYVNDGVVSDA